MKNQAKALKIKSEKSHKKVLVCQGFKPDYPLSEPGHLYIKKTSSG